MASSKLLKERIESIQDTRKITNAMYLISSSKLRKARKNYQNVLPYFTRMRDTISRVVPHLPDEPVHPFFHERNIANPKRAYIVLTADKGMASRSTTTARSSTCRSLTRTTRSWQPAQRPSACPSRASSVRWMPWTDRKSVV